MEKKEIYDPTPKGVWKKNQKKFDIFQKNQSFYI